MEYRKMKTSAEVFAVIQARHRGELQVFGSATDMERGRIFTSYGFAGCPIPLIEAVTQLTVDPEDERVRRDETHQYCLCVPKQESE